MCVSNLIVSVPVDEEFQSVSSQLLKRTQAMLDKYRLLLFEESKVTTEVCLCACACVGKLQVFPKVELSSFLGTALLSCYGKPLHLE